MANSRNDFAHTDFEPSLPSRLRYLNGRLNRTEPTDSNSSIFSTVHCLKAPSIVELENLTMKGNESFRVEPIKPVEYKKIKRKTPIHAFQPIMHSQDGRKVTKVYVTVVFLKIGQIETIKEYFEADVYLQAKWREPVLDNTEVRVWFVQSL